MEWNGVCVCVCVCVRVRMYNYITTWSTYMSVCVVLMCMAVLDKGAWLVAR